MKTANAQKIVAIFTAVSLAFLQAVPAASALPAAPRDQQRETGVSATVDPLANQQAPSKVVIPPNPLMNTGGISKASESSPLKPVNAIRLPPYPPAVQSYVATLQSQVGGGYKVTATKQKDGTYLISVVDSKVYAKAPTAGLHQMSFVLDAKAQLQKDSLQASYYGTHGDIKVDAGLLYEALKKLPQIPGLADIRALGNMSKLAVSAVDKDGTIHFELTGKNYKAYRNSKGAPVLEQEVPPAVQAYVAGLQQQVGGGFKVTATLQKDGTYLIIVADAKIYAKAPTAGLHQLSFSLSKAGSMDANSLQATYYGLKGDRKVDANLMYNALLQLPYMDGRLPAQPLDPAMPGRLALTQMTQVNVTGVDSDGAVHFLLGGQNYKASRDAKGKVLLEQELPPAVQAYVDQLKAAMPGLGVRLSLIEGSVPPQYQVTIDRTVCTTMGGGIQRCSARLTEQGRLGSMSFNISADGVMDVSTLSVSYGVDGVNAQLIYEAMGVCPQGQVCTLQVVGNIEKLSKMTQLMVTKVENGAIFFVKDGKNYKTYRDADGKVIVEDEAEVLRAEILARVEAEIAKLAAQIADYRARLAAGLKEWEAKVEQLKADLTAGKIDAEGIRAALEGYLGQVGVSDALKTEVQAYLAKDGSVLEGLGAAEAAYAVFLKQGLLFLDAAIRTESVNLTALKDHAAKVSAAKTIAELESLKDLPPRMMLSESLLPPVADPRIALNALLAEGKLLKEKVDALPHVLPPDVYQAAHMNLNPAELSQLNQAITDVGPNSVYTKQISLDGKTTTWTWTSADGRTTYVLSEGPAAPDGAKWAFEATTQVSSDVVRQALMARVPPPSPAYLQAFEQAFQAGAVFTKTVRGDDVSYQWDGPVSGLDQYAQNLTDQAQRDQFMAALRDVGPNSQYSIQIDDRGNQSWVWTSADGRRTYALSQNKDMIPVGINGEMREEIRWSFDAKTQVSRADVEQYARQLSAESAVHFLEALAQTDPSTVFTKIVSGTDETYTWGNPRDLTVTYIVSIVMVSVMNPDGTMTQRPEMHFSMQKLISPVGLDQYAQNLTDQAQRDQFHAAMLDVGPNSQYSLQTDINNGSKSWVWTSADGRRTYRLVDEKVQIQQPDGTMQTLERWSFAAEQAITREEVVAAAAAIPEAQRADFLASIDQAIAKGATILKVVSGTDTAYQWTGERESRPATYVIAVEPDGKTNYSIQVRLNPGELPVIATVAPVVVSPVPQPPGPMPTNIVASVPTAEGVVTLSGTRVANSSIWYSLDKGVTYKQLVAPGTATGWTGNVTLPVGTSEISIIAKLTTTTTNTSKGKCGGTATTTTTNTVQSDPVNLDPITYTPPVIAVPTVVATAPTAEGVVTLSGTKAPGTSIWYSLDDGVTYKALTPGISPAATEWVGKVTLPAGPSTLSIIAKATATVSGVVTVLSSEPATLPMKYTFTVPSNIVASVPTDEGVVTLSGTRVPNSSIWYSLDKGVTYQQFVGAGTDPSWTGNITLPVGTSEISIIAKLTRTTTNTSKGKCGGTATTTTTNTVQSDPVSLDPITYTPPVVAAPVVLATPPNGAGVVTLSGTRDPSSSIWYSVDDGATYKQLVAPMNAAVAALAPMMNALVGVVVGIVSPAVSGISIVPTSWSGEITVPHGSSNVLVVARKNATVSGVPNTVLKSEPVSVPIKSGFPAPVNIKVAGPSAAGVVTLSGVRATNSSIWYSLDKGVTYKQLVAAGSNSVWSGNITLPPGTSEVSIVSRMTTTTTNTSKGKCGGTTTTTSTYTVQSDPVKLDPITYTK